jgi:C4-type zinc-finger of DNA polymerase delta
VDVSRQNLKQKKQQTMDHFTLKGNCEICDLNISPILCKNCKKQLNSSLIILKTRMKKVEVKEEELRLICNNCTKFSQAGNLFIKNIFIGFDCCNNFDCNVFYERCRTITKLEDNLEITTRLEKLDLLEW